MRLTDYLPHGPAMSTPPSERVRDVLTARHSNENALFSRTGFALLICIFVSLTSAVPTFGHDTPEVRKTEGGKCQTEGTPDSDTIIPDSDTIIKDECDTHTLNEYWDDFVRTYPDEEYWYANSHWHMHVKGDGTVTGIGGWDRCLADKGYDKVKDNYDTSQCPGGTSTDPITPPQNDPNNAPVFNGPATKSVPENTPTTEVLLTVSATDSDSQDHVTYSKSGADASKFSLNSSGELRFSIVPDYENPQDSGTNNVYVVEVIATSGTGDRIRETTKTLTVTVTDVNEPPGRPNAPTVSADSETSLLVTWSAPANEGGPPITGYNYQYKKTSDIDSPGNWTERTTSGLSVPIGGLEEGISYDVQIQAKNGEGTSAWSLSGTGSTEANAAPSSPAQRRRTCRRTRRQC